MTPPAGVGLYVHLPWCVRKCPYCDFNSHPLKQPLPETAYRSRLLDDLEREFERFGRRRVETVYFGGGTPSLFSAETFGRLMERVPEAAEVTLEANPGTVERGDFADYRRAGVNRVSLGAQSFDPAQLKILGRIHTVDDIVRAVREARHAGIDNVNVDLMYGLPDQTVQQALDDLDRAIRLEPAHISWYQLTIEPRTEFARRPPPGLPNTDRAVGIEDAGLELLARHGYERYEVSAFARDGQRCRHNLNYWRFGDYIGIGAGAHGKLTTTGGRTMRIVKPSQPRRYLGGADASLNEVTAEELPGEFMMNALRLTHGVAPELFQARTGIGLDAIGNTLGELADWGLLRGDRLALTTRGYRQLNGVVARFL